MGPKPPFDKSHRQGPPTPSGLPPDYLARGYFDKDGCIFLPLVTDVARKVSESLGQGGVTSTQLRRFYNKAKATEQRLDAGENFACLKAEILELEQHAANAAGKARDRREQAGLELFKQFIDKNTELAVRDEKSFRKGFLLHFQGVVAFFKYLYPKK